MPSFEPSPPLAPLEPAAALPPAAETGLRFELSFSAVEGGACASFAWASGSVNNGSVGQVLCASYNPVGFPRGNLGSFSSTRSGLSCPWSAGYVPVQALITSRDTGRGPTAPHDTARPVTQF